jgi:putative nucleotidyltransferase with HDIG domain
MAERLERQVEEMRRTADDSRALFIGTVRGLAAAIDGKDPYTRGHSERVADYSAAMAAELGLSDEEIEKIRIGGLMHDIGKLAIEDKILRKPAPLTDAEFDIMREHPERGTKIMAEIPQMREFISGMRFHHEMVNGKGYPLGLSGDQIPMMARIVSVADTFDAMTTNRPYQKQMPIDVVFDKIRSMAGVRYDPKVVEALIAAYENGRIKLRMARAPQ